MFPRYGSYPGFHPIAELSMTFHTQVAGANGQRQAMFIERMEGLAEVILANFQFGPSDVMIVFSATGLTAVPIEMAMGARARGLPVVAVTSVAQSMARPPDHPTGTRLLDHADIVIDLCTPAGDALVTLEGLDTPIGPGSTVANAAIVNEIKVQTAAAAAGPRRAAARPDQRGHRRPGALGGPVRGGVSRARPTRQPRPRRRRPGGLSAARRARRQAGRTSGSGRMTSRTAASRS